VTAHESVVLVSAAQPTQTTKVPSGTYMTFPKRIFMLWQQGWDQAPDIVNVCRESWQKKNPNYELVLLDGNNLFEYVRFPKPIDLERPDFPVQKVAALSRLALLSRYGGVWADATTFCAKSLDDWLFEHMAGGFFAFANPGPDRLMANWFIAADADHIIVNELYDQFFKFFHKNYFNRLNTQAGQRDLKKYSAKWNSSIESTVRWHSFFARKVMRVYPYFIFHYTFNKIILENKECRDIWNNVEYLPARRAFVIGSGKKKRASPEERFELIENLVSPVFKLKWQYDTNTKDWSILLSLMRAHNDRRNSV
jgi:hypothetical protein